MQDTMLQQVMTEPGKIIFRSVPMPHPSAGQVLVKIKKIGVCGSDIHVLGDDSVHGLPAGPRVYRAVDHLLPCRTV